MTAAELLVKINGDATGYDKVMKHVEGRATGLANALNKAGRVGMAGLTAPIVAGAAVASNAYNKLKREQGPQNAREMAVCWRGNVKRRLDESKAYSKRNGS